MMNSLMLSFIGLPLLIFLIIIVSNPKREKFISSVAYYGLLLQFIALLSFIFLWIKNGAEDVNIKEIVLYKTADYEFYIDLFFDKISLVYLVVGTLLSLLVTVYTRYYLHREEGFKRFFATIMIFYGGYNLTVISGNLETLFIGWEMLGISSFLLIAFYYKRYLPVKNAVKVFSIYRLGDIGIILAMWMMHHLWHKNISFIQLEDAALVAEKLVAHNGSGIFISLMILLAAMAKSAQLPFTSWLPRAMEGPTPSSAIFYGSMSVHIGIFLLLRTFPFWQHQLVIKILIVFIGLSTALIAWFTSRVQSSIKAQIAYSSVAQIGLIFIEVAFGWHNIALLHFTGNAFLRTYQLLVSPSMVTYLIRDQFYNFHPKTKSYVNQWHKKLDNTLYIWSLQEWNLDDLLFKYLWQPLKILGKKIEHINWKLIVILLLPIYIIASVILFKKLANFEIVAAYLPIAFSMIGFLLVLKSFSERKSVKTAWILILANHFWTAIAVAFNGNFSQADTILYLSGVVVAGLLGFWVIHALKKRDKSVSLTRMHGYASDYPVLAHLFLLACLGVAGFPITTTFIGEDLIFSHIHHNQYLLASIIALGFIVDGLALIRIYARLFLGPKERTYNETSNFY